jgi:hypothetical protein
MDLKSFKTQAKAIGDALKKKTRIVLNWSIVSSMLLPRTKKLARLPIESMSSQKTSQKTAEN